MLELDDILARRERGQTWQEIGAVYGKKSDAMRKATVRLLEDDPLAVHPRPKTPDWRRPEMPSWREWFDNADDQNEKHKQIDPRQDALTVDFSHVGDGIAVVFVSDLHIGGGFTDHKAMRKMLEFLIETPRLYLAFVGDTIEGFLPGMKPAETVEQQPLGIRAQLAALESLVTELTEHSKLLYFTWGDHDAKWFEQAIGVNVVKLLLHSKVPYFNHRGLVKLKVGPNEYFILTNHGERGHSQWSDTHKLRRAYDKFFPADVIVAGHTHHPEYRTFYHYQQLQELGMPVGGKCHLLQLGTYKTGPDQYTCRYWEHGLVGVPAVVFSAGERDTDMFENPSKAHRFMEAA
jgi:predicted phosphodiesterase